MSHRETNAERVITGLFVGGCYPHKNDVLRLRDNVVYSQRTPIAKFIDEWDDEQDSYVQYLIVTLQDYKSQPSWKTHKKKLVEAALNSNLLVLFVPEFDIGFGISKVQPTHEQEIDNLLKVASYSNDPDIKTAALMYRADYDYFGDGNYSIDNRILAYTFNQEIDGEMQHAEKILVDYAKHYEMSCPHNFSDTEYRFYSLLEPCEDCLNAMIKQLNTTSIYYFYCHKDKWNTPSYIQLCNDIRNTDSKTMSIVSLYNRQPISYTKHTMSPKSKDKVENFYNKEKSK